MPDVTVDKDRPITKFVRKSEKRTVPASYVLSRADADKKAATASPASFYKTVVKRKDVRTILERLAKE